MTEGQRPPRQGFMDQIERYECHLWGLRLYSWTYPAVLRWFRRGSLRRVSRQTAPVLDFAKELLAEVEAGRRQEPDLAQFPWPPILPSMERRTIALTNAYDIVFPGRPRERLSKQEINLLRAALGRYL